MYRLIQIASFVHKHDETPRENVSLVVGRARIQGYLMNCEKVKKVNASEECSQSAELDFFASYATPGMPGFPCECKK